MYLADPELITGNKQIKFAIGHNFILPIACFLKLHLLEEFAVRGIWLKTGPARGGFRGYIVSGLGQGGPKEFRFPC